MARYRVQGDSMWPSIPDGCVVETRPLTAELCVGDVVVAKHPFRSDMLLVKRVHKIGATGLVLHGDAAHGSEDSRALGPFPLGSILGLVVSAAESTDTQQTRLRRKAT